MCEVAFLHPDLGIGGAERLIIDAAKAVMSSHPKTTVWTTYYDPNRCFSDTKELHIQVAGKWIPRSFFGFGHIIFSLISFLWLTISCIIQSTADVFIVDQISAWVWIIRLFRPNAKIIFYCHFPDYLLAPHSSLIRKLYRLPFDSIEKFGIKKSHLILVNSMFTQKATKQHLGITNTRVLYPCVDVTKDIPRNPNPTPLFLSLNRYERKKNHKLAVDAFAKANISNSKLIIAGGYDERVLENVENYNELTNLMKELGVSDKVELLRSIDDKTKWDLIAKATALLYTSQNEHFGIVPIEALSVGTPVIACASGGPCESVDVTGCYLCGVRSEQIDTTQHEIDSTSETYSLLVNDFADKMRKSVETPADPEILKKHVKQFGFEKFKEDWNDCIDSVTH